MRPVTTAAISSQTTSAPVVLDYRANSDPIAIGVILSSGAVLTYKVQYTLDDVFAAGWSAGTATWFDHPTLVNKTTSDVGNLAVPVTAIRLSVTAYTSGTATMKAMPNSGVGG